VEAGLAPDPDGPEAPIVIADYDPQWPREFEAEKQLLRVALAPWLVGSIEHVGSTAVPGLASKPIIDIMAPVHTLIDSRPAIEALKRLNYCYAEYRPDLMHWFCKPSPQKRTHHLHLIPLQSRLWRERLCFRNRLREDEKLATEYESLKKLLAAMYPEDRQAYTDAKDSFVREIVADA